jgi:hypothetical protein
VLWQGKPLTFLARLSVYISPPTDGRQLPDTLATTQLARAGGEESPSQARLASLVSPAVVVASTTTDEPSTSEPPVRGLGSSNVSTK